MKKHVMMRIHPALAEFIYDIQKETGTSSRDASYLAFILIKTKYPYDIKELKKIICTSYNQEMNGKHALKDIDVKF